MPNFALVSDGVVDNVIVTDDQAWADQYIADHGLHDVAIDVTDQIVSPGYLQKPGGFVPPYSLNLNKGQVDPDGADTSTITYTDNHDSPPASVDGNVNGQPVTLALTNGVGSLDITSTNSGDTITVSFSGLSVTVRVA